MTGETMTKKPESETADSHPTKLFFARMLTRDIEVDDAILDLIDNCVDGAMRTNQRTSKIDYQGYSVNIDISSNGFKISDNCGGIPHEILLNVALRMGRLPNDKRDEGLATVGVYGIGMKRAIFKLGKQATLYTQTAEGAYEVNYSEKWLNSDEDWNLYVNSVSPRLPTGGTEITINTLREDIASLFCTDTFKTDLSNKIGKHFSYIMEKGLQIKVNNICIRGVGISLLFDENCFNGKGIAPFIYKANLEGIEVSLAVGLYSDLPTDDDVEDSAFTTKSRATSEKAGWTVICNDRVILYADKTMNTGWGEADVPKYHTQFVSIAGVVMFRSIDPINLPVSTTKRSMQGDSTIWLTIKNVMRKGLKIFTDYTNHWKADLNEEKQHRKDASLKLKSIEEVLNIQIPESRWEVDRGVPGAHKFIPDLPTPKRTSNNRVVRFFRPASEIAAVSQILFDDPNQPPSLVGSTCFDRIRDGLGAQQDE